MSHAVQALWAQFSLSIYLVCCVFSRRPNSNIKYIKQAYFNSDGPTLGLFSRTPALAFTLVQTLDQWFYISDVPYRTTSLWLLSLSVSQYFDMIGISLLYQCMMNYSGKVSSVRMDWQQWMLLSIRKTPHTHTHTTRILLLENCDSAHCMS